MHRRPMKKHNHPIDDFFREALENHQMAPSEKARKAFLKEAIQVPRPAKKSSRLPIILMLMIAVVGTGITIRAILTDTFSTNENPGPKPSVPHSIASRQANDFPSVHQYNGKTTNNKSITTISNTRGQQPVAQGAKQSLNIEVSPEQPPVPHPLAKPPTRTARSNSMPRPLTMNPSSSGPIPVDPGTASDISKEAGTINITPMKPIWKEIVLKPSETRPDSILLPGRKPKSTPPEPYRKNGAWIPSIGIYYNPEWMFNTLEGSKFIHNFGIEGTFRFDRFSVRTGAGLSIGKGTNELIVEYNDFLGAYNKLDSMQLTWNYPEKQFLPKYYMSKQEVWDSLMKFDSNKVVKRFTYLQIPLIMGYDFWQTDLVSMGFRFGPVMSVLIASKQLSAEYDPGNKRIVGINDISPGQVSLNWQAMAGINASIRLSKGMLLEVEPSVKYYFNSVYEKPDDIARPWSIGIRTAFVIKL